jgi:hypothetical protein
MRITIWIARVTGGVAALLGWLFLLATTSIVVWIAHVAGVGPALQEWLLSLAANNAFILTHMVVGVTFALSLLALSLIQLLSGRMRLLGATGIVYMLILTVLGFAQTGLLKGPMHWLIQTVHVVIGFGGIALVQVISVRDARLRRVHTTVPPTQETIPEVVR